MSADCCGPELPILRDGRNAEDTPDPVRPDWWRDPALLPSVISGVALAAGYSLDWSGISLAGSALLWIALLAGAYTFVPNTLRHLIRGHIGVGLLMTIAAVGAVALGHVGEAAALAFLFSLAEALEDRAMDRAKEGLRALLSLLPPTARVARAGGEQIVPVSELRTGETLIVGAGDRVATDGVITDGRSSLDVSAVTGESIPVAVGPGDPVPAGAVNGAGTLRIKATADGSDNSLTHIVALVEQAHARKGNRARIADRIARPLVPTVLVVAALIAIVGALLGDPATWIERALVVLVAASPCALAIAVPVTVISAIGSSSRFGVVIKSGHAFEQFGAIRTVALDKTGTLTRNEPQVVEVQLLSDDHSREDVLRFAAALESSSTHPLATALTAAAPDTTPDTAQGIAPARDVTEEAGQGIVGYVGAARVRVGNTRWLAPGLHDTMPAASAVAANAAELTKAADSAEATTAADSAEAMAARGMTVVAVEVNGTLAALIGIRDELRDESAETVQMLRDMGMNVVMLTGDDQRTARALAAEAGINDDDVLAEQLPTDKAATIDALSAHAPTAMVGDGINDAPALATATVGIAMGATGSAAAIESADIAFTGHDLRLLPAALAHARRGRRIMTWNIGMALAIIIVLFPLALFGVLGLAGVVLVHEAAELVIILNGVRAGRRPSGSRGFVVVDPPHSPTHLAAHGRATALTR